MNDLEQRISQAIVKLNCLGNAIRNSTKCELIQVLRDAREQLIILKYK